MNLRTTVESLLNRDPLVVDENANKDSNVLGTQRDLLAGVVSKEYALEELLPPDVAHAHKSGLIHIHDLDYSLGGYFNCSLPDFPSLLRNGFQMGGASIQPPKSIRTAAEVIPQIVVNTSSNQYGGITVHAIDNLLEPYAQLSFDKYLEDAKRWVAPELQEEYAREKTIKEIKDSCQSIEYELNSCFSSSGQQPFVTISFGLTRSWLGREIQKAVLETRLEGLGAQKTTATFPKLIFVLKNGINLNKDDPNYDIKTLAMVCASKRIYPDILSFDKMIEQYGFFVSPMGCRSFLPLYEVDDEAVVYGRRNGGVVSLNLPRMALVSRTQEEMLSHLGEAADLGLQALAWRIDSLRAARAKNNPITYVSGGCGHSLNPNDPVIDIFKNGEASFSLGYVGLNETVTKFYGQDWYDNQEAVDFSVLVLKKLNEKIDSWNRESEFKVSAYGTPAESLTDRFNRLDTELFGVVPGITDKNWYTNSFHVDPRKKISPFDKFEFESKYVQYSAGGSIIYCEMPSLANNLDAIEAIWDFGYQTVPYFGINSPINKCFACGFEGDMDADDKGFFCPSCKNQDPEKLECIMRLCGYLSDVAHRKPIKGRVDEMLSRVKHA